VARLAHRPALTGLRAAAVLPVVALHATGRPAGGYLGVDLFFCLSGFLITHLLLDEHAATGRISLRGFYERRARRLLPALFVLLAVYATVELARGGRPLASVLAGIFYFTNLTYAFTPAAPTAITPLWSLAAEEQFYLVWPVLLIFLLRRRPGRLVPFLAGTLVLLAVDRVVLAASGASIERLYYGPDTRSDALIVGCLFAVWRQRGTHASWLPAACRRILVYGLIPMLLCLLVIGKNGGTLVIGLPLIAVYFGALIYLAAGDGAVARLLARRPLVYLGGISYSLYLWHLPVLFATHWAAWGLVGAVLVVPVAQLSTRYVERPFQRGFRRESVVPATA
jgi:peptidoglycan/LPS O-acetylase OafA/YrhL